MPAATEWQLHLFRGNVPSWAEDVVGEFSGTLRNYGLPEDSCQVWEYFQQYVFTEQECGKHTHRHAHSHVYTLKHN